MKKKSSLVLIALLCCVGSMNAQSFTPVRRVVLEDQTQCSPNFGQWGPRGIVRIDSFVNSAFGSMAEIISVHSNIGGPPNDLMIDSVYSNGCQFNSHLQAYSWPSIGYDRKIVNTEPDSIFIYFNKYAIDFGVADIEVNLAYDTTTRALDVTANTHFAVNTVNHNLALVLTEDSVHGTTIEYSQRNNYSGRIYGPMSGGGIDFVAQPDPVAANLMYYMHVARAILPSFEGDDESLPETAFADSFYSYTFPTYTVPVDYNASKMRAIVLLIDTENGQIINANGAFLVNPITAVPQVENGARSLSVFPNPFSDQTSLRFTLPAKEHVTIQVTDVLGRNISNYDLGVMSSGEHSIALNGRDMAQGVYSVTLQTSHSSLTRQIVLNK